MTAERRTRRPSLRWRLKGRRMRDLLPMLGRVNHVIGQSTTGAHIRNFWLLCISGLVLLSISSNQDTIRSQVKGRHFAIAVTCAFGNAIGQAGREVLLGSASPPGGARFVHNLEKLGYIPPVRRQREQVAKAYVEHITEAVEKRVGPKRGSSLVLSDGSLDCKRLQRLAASATR